jgi:hypothetical protein
MREWLDRLGEFLGTPRTWLGRGDPGSVAGTPATAEKPAKSPASQLMKPRREPRGTLEDRYQLLEADELADEVFQRLRSRVYTALNRISASQHGRPQHYREMGRLSAGKRSYFYVQPMGRAGILFERSGAGWVVSPAERIVHQQTFLRSQEPIDTVSLYLSNDSAAYPRVRSSAEGDSLLALAVYEQRLLTRLGLE